jgi:hypothetical protein
MADAENPPRYRGAGIVKFDILDRAMESYLFTIWSSCCYSRPGE